MCSPSSNYCSSFPICQSDAVPLGFASRRSLHKHSSIFHWIHLHKWISPRVLHRENWMSRREAQECNIHLEKKKKKNTQPNKKPLSQPPNNPNLQNPQTYPNDFSKYNSECRMDPTWDGSSNHSQQYIQPLGLVQSQDSCVRHSREIFFLQEMESCKFSLERCRTWNSPDSGCSLGFE